MNFRLLMVTLILITIFSFIRCTPTDDGREAGIEFCNCLKKYSNTDMETAFDKCHDSISGKHRLLKIYIETRGNIYDFYSQETIDSVNNFATDFAKAVDSCNPPFWFKK